jgi:hypothetical protein
MAQLRGYAPTDDAKARMPKDADAPANLIGQLVTSTPNVDNIEKKFGMFEGVVMRVILNIVGVMQYMRISQMAGNAGIGLCVDYECIKGCSPAQVWPVCASWSHRQ